MRLVASRLGAAQRRLPLLQLVALVALFLYGAATIDGFSQAPSIRSMLVLASLLGLAAAGQTLVLLLGALDLSIPGLIVLGATVISELCGSEGWALVPALAVVVALCAVVGATVGWLCHRFRVMPIIVTLAVSSLALGSIQVWTHGTVTGSAPQLLSDLVAVNGTTAGLPVSPVVVIWGLFAVLIGVFLHRTHTGRRIYATGANQRAAELSLVNTRRVWMGIFCASAVLSGIVGVLLAGFAGADPTLGDPYLFQGLTAVIVGGTAFMGSRGDYTHTVIGALILTELTTIMVGRGSDAADQQIIFGVLILVVVAGYGRERRLRDRV
ncbi:MAG: ABC transporter permease [Actinomycetota bacterium]|nr:ABC transporter permease [Actinomycetota bacterium]